MRFDQTKSNRPRMIAEMIAMTMTTIVAARTSLRRRPRDLLQLGRDLVGEACRRDRCGTARCPTTIATTPATSEIVNSLGGAARSSPRPSRCVHCSTIEQQRPPRTRYMRWTGLFGAFSCWATSRRCRDLGVLQSTCWQGRQDLNLQPSALETDALPLSYSPRNFDNLAAVL